MSDQKLFLAQTFSPPKSLSSLPFRWTRGWVTDHTPTNQAELLILLNTKLVCQNFQKIATGEFWLHFNQVRYLYLVMKFIGIIWLLYSKIGSKLVTFYLNSCGQMLMNMRATIVAWPSGWSVGDKLSRKMTLHTTKQHPQHCQISCPHLHPLEW